MHYRSGLDLFTGQPITQEEADQYFMWYMQSKSWFGRLSPMAQWRWHALDKVGHYSWRGNVQLEEDWEEYED